MKTIFVTERPTQIITALALCDNLDLKEEVQIIVANRFDDASKIVRRLSDTETRLNFRLVSNYDDAIEIAAGEQPTHLFIHWDVGFGTQKRLRRLKQNNTGLRISIFEEGIGTYRQDIYPPLKKLIFKMLGLPVNVGGSRYINDIYVYDREKYISNARVQPRDVIQINPRLVDVIAEKEAQLVFIFSGQELIEALEASDRSVCTIYLSDWHFKETDLEGLVPNRGARVLKLHPHCKAHLSKNDILIAPNSLPAELLVMVASRLFEFVIIYHHGSSVPLYISPRNVEFKILDRVSR